VTASGGIFDASERHALEADLREGRPLTCPVCAVPLSVQAVAPGGDVAYVRRRVWALCPACRRSAGLDAPDR
jgi:hypothetical protein